MKIIFLCIFFLPTSWGAFTYTPKPAEISKSDFHRYIIPQLRSINREFFTLMQDFHPQHRFVFKLKKNVELAIEQGKMFQSKCSVSFKAPNIKAENSNACSKSLSQVKTNWVKIGNFLNQASLSLQDPSKGVTTEKLPSLQTTQEHLFNMHLKISNKISSIQFTFGTDLESNYEIKDVLKDMEMFEKSYDIYLFNSMRSDSKEMYFAAYRYFVTPIKIFVLSKKNKKYLLKNIEKLNFAWNDFHMKLTKTNRPVSKGTSSLATQIHRRWNSILKIALR